MWEEQSGAFFSWGCRGWGKGILGLESRSQALGRRMPGRQQAFLAQFWAWDDILGSGTGAADAQE